MTSPEEPLGLIAGSGSLPFLLSAGARKAGVRKIVAVAFDGETNPELASTVDKIVWLKVGQLTKMIEALKKHHVRKCAMAGQISPKSLFNVRPDLRAVAILLKLKEKNAHSIFGAIGDELRKEGIELVEATPWLRAAMPDRGFVIGKPLNQEQQSDVDYGFRIAKEISRLEIGQIVVVKNGVVLAVEGFEGTDACIARGGSLSGNDGSAVAVKVAKEKHDMRFDIPCIGPKTLESCRAARVRVLAIEAGRTIILDQAEMEQLARKHGITIVTVG